MPRSNARGRVGQQLQQRRMAWIRTVATPDDGGQGFAVDLLEDFRTENGGAQPLGLTITRTRLQMQAEPGDATVNANSGMYFGMYVASRNITTADLPLPPAELHEDYMAFGFIGRGEQATNTTFGRTTDVKSQRRLDELGETLWLVGALNGLTVPATVFIVASVLVKLP